MIDNLSRENNNFIRNIYSINFPENYNLTHATYYQFQNPVSNELSLYVSISHNESLKEINSIIELNKKNTKIFYHTPIEIEKNKDSIEYKLQIDIYEKNLAYRVKEYFLEKGNHIFMELKDFNIMFFTLNFLIIEIFIIILNIYNKNLKRVKFLLYILFFSVFIFLSLKSFRHLLWLMYISIH